MTYLQSLCYRLVSIKNWGTDWKSRGVYLHLECSELIEAWRGKNGGNVRKELADVLNVCMQIAAINNINWPDIESYCELKVKKLLDNSEEA